MAVHPRMVGSLLFGCYLLTGCASQVNQPSLQDELLHEAWKQTQEEQGETLNPQILIDLFREVEQDWEPIWWNEPMELRLASQPPYRLLQVILTGSSYYMDPSVMPERVIDTVNVATSATASDTTDVLLERPIILPTSLATKGAAVEYICEQTNIWCMPTEHNFRIERTRSIPYRLTAQPGSWTGQMAVTSLAESTGSSSISFALTPYAELSELLNQLIDSEDEDTSFYIREETNEIFITARPQMHYKLREVIDNFNERYSELVEVRIAVFEVKLDRERGFSITPTGSTLLADDDLAGDLRAQITDTIVNQNLDLSYINVQPENSFGWALRLLRSVAEAEVVFKEVLETRNNLIVTSENVREQSFLKELTETRETEPNTGLSTRRIEANFEDLTTGWSVSIQPTLAADELITLRVALQRNDLVSLIPYSFGESTGNNFITDKLARSLSVTLRNGESRLVSTLSSFDTNRSSGFTRRAQDSEQIEFAILLTATLTTPHQS